MDNVYKKNLRIWLVCVLLVAIALRVGLILTYPPVSFNDTHSYRRSANAILNEDQVYDGTRTPGYPAWMALVGDDRAVYASQLLLGLGITMMWFFIGYLAGGKVIIGGLAALAHTLNPGQLFFEANLLTETLSTFWLVLALLGVCVWCYRESYRKWWLGAFVGLAVSLAILTRPLFIFLPILLAFFLGLSIENKLLRINWKAILGVLLPSILLVGGWMRWVHNNYQVFSLTAMTGYHLVQHTGYYFEDVPDVHAELRDVYLAYRDARVAERGTQGNAIWDAIPAMQEASGLGFYQLSQVLQEISIDLILRNPGLYLSYVIRGWWLFWRAPVYWNAAGFPWQILSNVVSVLIIGARGLLFMMNLLFLFGSIAALVSKRLREIWSLAPFHFFLLVMVWLTSVASSLLDHGDNPRFLVPLQTVVVFLVLWAGYHTWIHWKQSKLKMEKVIHA